MSWWAVWGIMAAALVVQAVGLLWLLVSERRDRG